MAEIEPLSPAETSDLLSPLSEAPVPEGMAQKAVHRWIEESRRSGTHGQRATMMGLAGLRAAAALAAAAILLVVVRSRIGENVTPSAGPGSVRSSAAHEADTRTKAAQAPSPRVPSGTRAMRTRSKGGEGQIRSAGAPRTSRPQPSIRADRPLPATPPIVAEKSMPSDATAPQGAPQPSDPELREARMGMADNSPDLAYLNSIEGAGRRASAPVSFADARLARPITLAEDEISLADLSGKIGSGLGLDIVLSGRLKRQPIAIHCTDRPVGEVFRMIAAALELRWEVSGSGAARRYAAVPARNDSLNQAEHTATHEAARMVAAGMGGASSAQAGPAASDQARKAADLNIVGPPARVRDIRQGGAAPTDAIQADGWIILR